MDPDVERNDNRLTGRAYNAGRWARYFTQCATYVAAVVQCFPSPPSVALQLSHFAKKSLVKIPEGSTLYRR